MGRRRRKELGVRGTGGQEERRERGRDGRVVDGGRGRRSVHVITAGTEKRYIMSVIGDKALKPELSC